MTGNYTSTDVGFARSFLFVPGNRPERFMKAQAAKPDIVVIDLEDAVAPADKCAARASAEKWLAAGNPAMVRINAVGTEWHDDDLRLAAQYAAPVMLAKAECVDDISHVARLADAPVVPLVETATGLLAAQAICAAAGVTRPAFGSIDLAVELGVDPDDRSALQMARSMLVLAAAAAGTAPPVDGVTTVLTTRQAVTDDFGYAKRLGMSAKLCIHPSQVAAVHAAAAPSAAELRWAREVIDGCNSDGSAIAVAGRMVDGPVMARARRIITTHRQV
ncbi:HpcH/HpaI aldolase/citrate lyase family protein [Mycobacterium aquaticum]|uniref:CoA ester lyase n=1 Tax=Mycobacterium aquaticum TaxID=1927124 RepID=A0A1X0AVB8_9MYCO|nr:CoA ester lyase [Mycobacterium aquaticum]ORA33983.1 CoA ester lyase [Mycobacterium aquaticum]